MELHEHLLNNIYSNIFANGCEMSGAKWSVYTYLSLLCIIKWFPINNIDITPLFTQVKDNGVIYLFDKITK